MTFLEVASMVASYLVDCGFVTKTASVFISGHDLRLTHS